MDGSVCGTLPPVPPRTRTKATTKRAPRKSTTQHRAELAAKERLRALTVVQSLEVPDDKAEEIDAHLRDLLAFADRIVRECNASWERGELSDWLADVRQRMTRHDLSTRLILKFLVALNDAARLRYIADGPGHVAFVLSLHDAPSGRRASTPEGVKAIGAALREWRKPLRGGRRWEAVQTAVDEVLKRKATLSSIAKIWARHVRT